MQLGPPELWSGRISRYASLLDGLERNLLGDSVFHAIVERDLSMDSTATPTS